MLIKAILLGLVGIVGVIDSRLIGRQNIGRPLILSTLAGLVLGDVRQGVILGASLELISMGFVAIGAAGPPNMQFGSIIATAFAILSGASTEAGTDHRRSGRRHWRVPECHHAYGDRAVLSCSG